MNLNAVDIHVNRLPTIRILLFFNLNFGLRHILFSMEGGGDRSQCERCRGSCDSK